MHNVKARVLFSLAMLTQRVDLCAMQVCFTTCLAAAAAFASYY